MKRIFLVLISLAVLLTSTAFAAPATSQTDSTVTVTGHAELAVIPDTAYVSVGIVTMGADVVSAKNDNDRIMNNIFSSVASLGIGKEQVRTAGFSVQPQYKQNLKYDEPTAITGYRVQNTITITVSDFALISPVIDLCAQAGANQISGLRFAIKDEAKFKDKLLEKAILDGKSRASLIANTLGGSLGRPLSMQVGGFSNAVNYDNVRLAKAEMSSTPVSAGTVNLSVDVNMVFQLN